MLWRVGRTVRRSERFRIPDSEIADKSIARGTVQRSGRWVPSAELHSRIFSIREVW